MRKSPRLLAASNWLESQAGHRLVYGLALIAPAVMHFMDWMGDRQMTFQLIGTGICVICAMGTAAFWLCGKSLMQAIDVSLQRQHQQLKSLSPEEPNEMTAEIAGTTSSRQGSNGDLTLLAARKKVKMVLTFVTWMGAATECMMIFDIVSGYGAAQPLVLLVAPLAVTAPVWYGVNIQVHGGRSDAGRQNSKRRVSLSTTRLTHGWISRRSTLLGFEIQYPQTRGNRVLPTEDRMISS